MPLGLDITDVSATGANMTFVVGTLSDPTPPMATNVDKTTSLDIPVTITLAATDEGLPVTDPIRASAPATMTPRP